MGAAVFNTATSKLALFDDIPDAKPNFEILANLINQTYPDHVIASSRLDEDFRKGFTQQTAYTLPFLIAVEKIENSSLNPLYPYFFVTGQLRGGEGEGVKR